jgi:hypothetical protein
MGWFHLDQGEKKNGLVTSSPRGKGCIQTKGKRNTSWDPAHGEKKNGLVSSSPWGKEKWAGWIQPMGKRTGEWRTLCLKRGSAPVSHSSFGGIAGL